MNTRLLPGIAFLFMVHLASAQHWVPIAPQETYHYRVGNADFITHTIRVDSVHIQGADSVYFLNRVALATQGAVMVCMSQFMGEKVLVYENGQVAFHYPFSVPLTIIPTAEPGVSWVADPVYHINAVVTEKTWGTVLGVPDSLKTISLSNGAQWIISKNHGVIACPGIDPGTTALLSGIESKQLGDRLYRFEDFFDMQPGTVMEYSETSGITYSTVSLDQKVRILDKQFSPDTALYQVERLWKKTAYAVFPEPPTITYGKDTVLLTFLRSAYPNLKAYNHALIPVFNNPGTGSIARVTSNSVETGVDPSGGTCSVWLLNNGCLLACAESPYKDWRETFRQGLGQTDTYQIGEPVNGDYYAYYKIFKGAVINGDTVLGSVSPDWIFTGSRDLTLPENDFKIYPNPATDRLVLEAINPAVTPTDILLFSLEGKCIERISVSGWHNSMPIALTNVPPGMYLLAVQVDNQVWRGKFIKAR